jgi:hypothetical protein
MFVRDVGTESEGEVSAISCLSHNCNGADKAGKSELEGIFASQKMGFDGTNVMIEPD